MSNSVDARTRSLEAVALKYKYFKESGLSDFESIARLLGSDEIRDASQHVGENSGEILAKYRAGLRKNIFKNLTGISAKKAMLIGVGGIIGLSATLKCINAFINYETQRLAVKNGIKGALPVLQKTGA